MDGNNIIVDIVDPYGEPTSEILKFTEYFPNFYKWIGCIIILICCIFAVRIYFIKKENQTLKKKKIKHCVIIYSTVLLLLLLFTFVMYSLNIEIKKDMYSHSDILSTEEIMFFYGINIVMVIAIVILLFVEIIIDNGLKREKRN